MRFTIAVLGLLAIMTTVLAAQQAPPTSEELALFQAANNGELEVVRLLLERGADPTLEDVDGDTALSFAREHGHTAVVEALETAGTVD